MNNMNRKMKYLKEKFRAVHEGKAKSLGLSWEFLDFIPQEVFYLESLEALIVNNNKIASIPPEIQNLRNLTYLDFSDNQLSDFPIHVSNLVNLTNLSLRSNKIGQIPSDISKLENLEVLDLSNNLLSDLPDEIGDLKKLRRLRLSANNFKKIPECIFRLTQLNELVFAEETKDENDHNFISSIPYEFVLLGNLKKFTIKLEVVEAPPPEIVSRGIQSIQNYLRQISLEGKDYLFEAKLLIVGEGGAGKTTLAKKIKDPSYKVRHEEDTTQGIDVKTWEIKIPPGFKINNSQPLLTEKNFRVNIWDFGGQEIYHATHQFFLTKRSLYALVADTRREDTDFYYWLSIVGLLSGNSPVIIVKNEKQDRRKEINERQLMAQFPNLKEILATNLATNRGFGDVLRYIFFYVTSLPHVGIALPKTWVNVRRELENSSKYYISQEDYLNICRKNGFHQLRDALQLSSYLHDLGVFLHFQSDPLLKYTVILKPEWGTDAVYKVFDNERVRDQLGIFTKDQLNEIWDDEKYTGMHDELLQLMIKFQLCYPLPEQRNTYIAPQLLSENQPEYEWINDSNLLLRYTYKFMPKGMLTRFIVVMHQYIEAQDLVWKRGVLLVKDNTRAEVIENYITREITIRIYGALKREFMAIVSHELDKIHTSFNDLKYDKLIPCHCEKCALAETPHFYPLEILYKFISDKQSNIQCPISYKMVEVFSLIDNVMMISTDSGDIELKNIRISTLSSKLSEAFDNSELKGLCLDMEVNYEDLIGDTHMNRIQSLIGYLNRRNRINHLLQSLKALRPNVKWV